MIFRSNFYFPIVIMFALGLNNTIIGYRLFDIPYDRLIELLLFISLLPILCKDIKIDDRYKDVLVLFVVIFFCLVGRSFLALSQGAPYIPAMDVFRDVVRCFYFIILLMLVNYSVIRNPGAINFYLVVMFIWVLMGFLQNPITPYTGLMNDIRLTYFLDNMTDVEQTHSFREITGSSFLSRSTGPYGFAISFSYALLSVLIVSAYQYLLKRQEKYFYFSMFIYLVILMSLTRSAALAGGLVVIYLIYNKSKSLFALMACLVLAFIFYIALFTPELAILESRLAGLYQGSARINAFTAGFMTILEEPFFATSETYIKNFYAACSMYEMRNCGVPISSHNGFVNIIEMTTIIGGIAFIFLWCLLGYYSLLLPKPFSGFFVVSLIAYSIQSSLHNNMLFLSEYSFILPVVLLVREVSKVKRLKNQQALLGYSGPY